MIAQKSDKNTPQAVLTQYNNWLLCLFDLSFL